LQADGQSRGVGRGGHSPWHVNSRRNGAAGEELGQSNSAKCKVELLLHGNRSFPIAFWLIATPPFPIRSLSTQRRIIAFAEHRNRRCLRYPNHVSIGSVCLLERVPISICFLALETRCLQDDDTRRIVVVLTRKVFHSGTGVETGNRYKR
jgi:hypothetical protein